MTSKIFSASVIIPSSTTTTTPTKQQSTTNIILSNTATQTPNQTAQKSVKPQQTKATMDWSNEKLHLNCGNGIVNISVRQVWKLLLLNSNSGNSGSENSLKQQKKDIVNNQKNNKLNNINNDNANTTATTTTNNNIAEYNREFMPPLHKKMSLLKSFAINALELSAPASPVLLQHGNIKPRGWVQLSGHPESIQPTATGIVRKRIPNMEDNELKAYQSIESDPYANNLTAEFYGVRQMNGEYYLEMQDLLANFKDPNVMDIKMGCRTFAETEVTNQTPRPDLYKKMISVDINAPTVEEHQSQSITKLRYMQFREALSSSHSKGFRIEALRMRGSMPNKDLKTVRSSSEIEVTISNFMNGKKSVCRDLLKRLKSMRTAMEKSEFFRTHEIVGSSIFIVYDDEKANVWLIDFAKAKPLPKGSKLDHRKPWVPGNREEGLLKGMDELIKVFEDIYESS